MEAENQDTIPATEIDSNEANQEFLDYEDSDNSELEAKVVEACRNVFDPEIPVNIYDLGLIYDISITKSNEVVTLMTLTSPNCPVAGGLPKEVEDKIGEIKEVVKSKVILTFEPAWGMDLMSDEAKLELGLL